MGLPRYVINYAESEPHIRKALEESVLPISVGEIDFSEQELFEVDTSSIEIRIDDINNKNLIVNEMVEDLISTIKQATKEVKDLNDKNTIVLDEFNDGLQVFVDDTIKTREIVEDILNLLQPSGTQQIRGFYNYAPPIKGDFKITFTVPEDIKITAVTYSQIGWKFNDAYSLIIDGTSVLENVYTKEVAEKKSLRMPSEVSANTPIDFILHNNSGNSRQLWLDIEYVLVRS